MSKRTKIIHEGILDLNGLEMPCYVTENGTRVLSGRGMQGALNMVDEPSEGKGTSGARLSRYFGQKSLNPYILGRKEQGHFDPIICYKGTKKIHGYEATLLADICDGFLEARKHIKLSVRQSIIADQCEVLMRAFAKVGITALVDEATGYQYDREKGELQKILKQYISEELLPWQKKFPDIFYKELFRLNGWDFTVNGIKKRPGVIGTWTKKLVYEQLPKGVLSELEKNTPKNLRGKKTAKMHQLLTDEIGNPHLTAQINQMVTLFQLSDNMKHMWIQFEKLKIRQSGQLDLPFKFDDNGHTIEPTEKTTLSTFNNNLLTALNSKNKSKVLKK
jgi:hypothetical protein